LVGWLVGWLIGWEGCGVGGTRFAATSPCRVLGSLKNNQRAKSCLHLVNLNLSFLINADRGKDTKESQKQEHHNLTQT